MSWPGPDPAELADGSLVVSATIPRPGVVVVRAIGEIDLLTAPGWRRTLDAAVRMLQVSGPEPVGTRLPACGGAPREAKPRLVSDLSAVSFLGGSGLDVLVALDEQSALAGVELRVVADTRPVLRLLRLTGLDRRLATDTGLEVAVGPAPEAGVAS